MLGVADFRDDVECETKGFTFNVILKMNQYLMLANVVLASLSFY
jgi:hypothetical protein